MRARIEQKVPALRVEFVEIMQDMIGDLSGNPNPVEIKLFGRDEAKLEQAARAANGLIAGVPGIVDNFDGITPVGPTYQVTVDEQRANLVGLNAAAVRQLAGDGHERHGGRPGAGAGPRRFRCGCAIRNATTKT